MIESLFAAAIAFHFLNKYGYYQLACRYGVQGTEIPTNTVRFREYTFSKIFTNAQSLGRRWNLDESLITTDKVTYFDATPAISGASVCVIFNDRYVLGSNGGDYVSFTDRGYDSYMVSPYETNYVDVLKCGCALPTP